ncbi:MAG: AmmeMemoRadiSam system protein B [Planctomycetes bacterium]|nr:AmmeMemoRadiSam system protein B [Planctomycetota bacterium]
MVDSSPKPDACTGEIRPPVFAGSWYPATAAELERAVDGFLAPAQSANPHSSVTAAAAPATLGLVVPHAGYRYSGPTAGKAFADLRGARARPRRVLLLGPNHRGEFFRGLATSAFAAYRTPLGLVPVDVAAVDALRALPLFSPHRGAEESEHALELELPFLQRVLGDFRLVPLIVGELGPRDYEPAAAALGLLLDGDTLVVASSDFTHYGDSFGYVPFRADVQQNLSRLDGGAIEFILAGQVGAFLDYQERTGITVCGYRPIALLLHLLRGVVRGRLLEYTTSGAVTGDFRHSVSYAAIAFNS